MIFKETVENNNGKILSDIFSYIGISKRYNAVDLILCSHAETGNLFFRYSVRTAEQQFKPSFVKRAFYMIGKGSKKRVGGIGNDKRDEIAFLGL